MPNIVGNSADPVVAGVTGQHSAKGTGVNAISRDGEALHAHSESVDQAAVAAFNVSPNGTGAAVFAHSKSGPSMHAHNESAGGSAVVAFNVNPNSRNAAVFAHNKNFEAVHAHTESIDVAAVAAFNVNPNGTGAAVFGKKEGTKGHAGFFDGNVHMTRGLNVEGIADIKAGLIVNGESVTSRIGGLEREIASLKTFVGSSRFRVR